MKKDFPKLLASDARGRIFSHPQLQAAGMAANLFFRLDPSELIRLPAGSRLFIMPARPAVGYDSATGGFGIPENGYSAIGAFLSAGYTATYNSAYQATSRRKALPLFSYAAAALFKGELCAAALRVDGDQRHDCRFINISDVKNNVRLFRKIFRHNRLVRHLEHCALIYGCPNAQNFFLSRYECPLPTSPSCNAACVGCISYQKEDMCRASQPRISFMPFPEEIAEIALYHISKVKKPIVSFGQGCEGEPLLGGTIIENAIRAIRRKTSKGVININTNGSKPEILSRLFDAGLDSARISLNSVQEQYYKLYYKPKRYGFHDVKNSLKVAKEKKKFVSVNYLTMPGFTDWQKEADAFEEFIERYRIDMVQWRNLNFDPMLYFRILKVRPKRDELTGIRQLIDSLEHKFPSLVMGYFNPSRNKINRLSAKRR